MNYNFKYATVSHNRARARIEYQISTPSHCTVYIQSALCVHSECPVSVPSSLSGQSKGVDLQYSVRARRVEYYRVVLS